MMKVDFDIGEIVEVKSPRRGKPHKKAVVLGFEENALFESVQCVKLMYLGGHRPTYTLSDRVSKL